MMINGMQKREERARWNDLQARGSCTDTARVVGAGAAGSSSVSSDCRDPADLDHLAVVGVPSASLHHHVLLRTATGLGTDKQQSERYWIMFVDSQPNSDFEN